MQSTTLSRQSHTCSSFKQTKHVEFDFWVCNFSLVACNWLSIFLLVFCEPPGEQMAVWKLKAILSSIFSSIELEFIPQSERPIQDKLPFSFALSYNCWFSLLAILHVDEQSILWSGFTIVSSVSILQPSSKSAQLDAKDDIEGAQEENDWEFDGESDVKNVV